MSKGKIITIRIVLFLILMTSLVFISYQSVNTAEESNEQSIKVTKAVLTTIVPNFKEKSEPEQNRMIRETNNVIRELAHFIEFIPLGLSFSGIIHTYRKSNFKEMKKIRFCLLTAIWTAIFGLLYGIYDECHQLFVDGRGFQVLDITLDTLGCITGILITLGFVMLFTKSDEIKRFSPRGLSVSGSKENRLIKYSLKK